MSIFDAMYTGASGLDAESSALGVIGNNVANQNTVGFKESRAIFESVMGSATGAAQIGGGVSMSSTQQIFAQGSLQTTNNPTDVALQGNGFFVVNGSVGGTTGDFYTRAGQTSLNATGTLVNPDGLALQGYAMQPNGQMSSQLGPISLSAATLQPKATTTVTLAANLNSNAAQPAKTPFDPTDPTTYNGSPQSIQVYDSLGAAHSVNVYYVKTGANSWDYHETTDGGGVSGGTAGQAFDVGDGSLSFDATGALASQTSTNQSFTFNGASQETLTVNLGTPTSAGGTGRDGLTQNGETGAGDVVPGTQSQDGYGSGDLSGVQIGADGTVSGTYTNGQTLAVGRLAVATFQSDTGLSNAGQNLWSATQKSGDASLGAAGAGGRGSIQSGALEQSNVDIASQFVELIAHQQGYEANSKTITTVDQMLSTLQQMIS